MTQYEIDAFDFEIFIYDTVTDLADDEAVRLDYLGRGMYSKTCVGFVTSNPYKALLEIGMLLGINADVNDEENFDIPSYVWLGVSVDSMGRDTIVYWPRICVKADEDETDI